MTSIPLYNLSMSIISFRAEENFKMPVSGVHPIYRVADGYLPCSPVPSGLQLMRSIGYILLSFQNPRIFPNVFACVAHCYLPSFPVSVEISSNWTPPIHEINQINETLLYNLSLLSLSGPENTSECSCPLSTPSTL